MGEVNTCIEFILTYAVHSNLSYGKLLGRFIEIQKGPTPIKEFCACTS